MIIKKLEHNSLIVPLLNKYATSENYQVVLNMIDKILKDDECKEVFVPDINTKFLLNNTSELKNFKEVFLSKNIKIEHIEFDGFNIVSNLLINPLIKDEEKIKLVTNILNNFGFRTSILALKSPYNVYLKNDSQLFFKAIDDSDLFAIKYKLTIESNFNFLIQQIKGIELFLKTSTIESEHLEKTFLSIIIKTYRILKQRIDEPKNFPTKKFQENLEVHLCNNLGNIFKSEWFKNSHDKFKNRIHNYVLKIGDFIDGNRLLENNFKSSYYKYVEIKNAEELDYIEITPVRIKDYLDSVNMKKREYAEIITSKIRNETFDISSFVAQKDSSRTQFTFYDRYRYFYKYFNEKKDNVFLKYISILKNSEIDILDCIKKIAPINLSEELDFIFKREFKDGDEIQWREQFKLINDTCESENFLMLSLENIHLMEFLYNKNKVNWIVDSIIHFRKKYEDYVFNKNILTLEFNVNNFLEKDLGFQEFYIDNIVKILEETNLILDVDMYDKIFKIIDAKPELREWFKMDNEENYLNQTLKMFSYYSKMKDIQTKELTKPLSIEELEEIEELRIKVNDIRNIIPDMRF